MIILGDVLCQYLQSVQVELPRPNMMIDPRANHPDDGRFECFYHDDRKTVTLTRIDDHPYHGRFELRAYDPNTEAIPDFTSTTYMYYGIEGERVPKGTTVLMIDPSVEIIRDGTFAENNDIKVCIMHDGVHDIEQWAFAYCSSLKVVKISRSITRIEMGAFAGCISLDALFLPPTVKSIEGLAFDGCKNIRILPLPLTIDIQRLGQDMIQHCFTLFQTTQIQGYRSNHNTTSEVHQSLINFYRNLPPLHKACLETNVTAQSIRGCVDTHGRAVAYITDHDGMTPLHILAMNPHADTGSMIACFDANMIAALIGDRRQRTPLDYLREYGNLECHGLLVAALCMNRVCG